MSGNPFTEFFHSPSGREIQSCIERIDISLRSIAESLEKIANPLIREILISGTDNSVSMDLKEHR